LTGAAPVHTSSSASPEAVPPLAGVSTNCSLAAVTGAVAPKLVQAAGSSVRLSSCSPAMVSKLPAAVSACTVRRYGAGPNTFTPATGCGASNVACTEDWAKATCCVVVSRSKRSGALAASCARTSGGSDDEERTVSENGVAFEPSGSTCPVGTTAA
jgi:hypothetical protein